MKTGKLCVALSAALLLLGAACGVAPADSGLLDAGRDGSEDGGGTDGSEDGGGTDGSEDGGGTDGSADGDAAPMEETVQGRVIGLHSPPFLGAAGRDSDPFALTVELNGASLTDALGTTSGREFAFASRLGSSTLEARLAEAPGTLVASATWEATPLVVTDPDFGEPYVSAGEKYLFFTVGAEGSFSSRMVVMNYDPPTTGTWRITVVNGRVDSAISGALVEVSPDDGAPLAEGELVPLFESLLPGGSIELEVQPLARPKLSGLQLWADESPPASREEGLLPLFAPNVFPEVEGSFIPTPDGSVMVAWVHPAVTDGSLLTMETTFFFCRDDRFRELVRSLNRGECPNPVPAGQ